MAPPPPSNWNNKSPEEKRAANEKAKEELGDAGTEFYNEIDAVSRLQNAVERGDALAADEIIAEMTAGLDQEDADAYKDTAEKNMKEDGEARRLDAATAKVELNKAYKRYTENQSEENYQRYLEARVAAQETADLHAQHQELEKQFENLSPDFWDLKNGMVGKLIVGAALGDYVGRQFGWWGDDDEPPEFDIEGAVSRSIDLMTDPKNRSKLIGSEVEDTGHFADITQRNRYEEQFGPVTDVAFNHPEYGPDLEQRYREAMAGKDGEFGTADDGKMNRGDWLLSNYRDWDPADPAKQWFGREISAVGQIGRAGSEFAGLERKSLLESLDEAAKFYTPKEAGGYGYDPNDFRSDEQSRAVAASERAAAGPVSQALEGSVLAELEKGRELSEGEYSRTMQSALQRLSPGLQRQMNVPTGGGARSLDAILGHQDARLARRQQAAANYMGQASAAAVNHANVLSSNTLDPLQAVGVQAGTGRNAYAVAGSPEQAPMYDPYGMAGSLAAQEYKTAAETHAARKSGPEVLLDARNRWLEGTR